MGLGFRLDAVTVRYGAALALDGVDLSVAPGEVVALVGPSGSGKTTLLQLLNGSVRPTDGTVVVDDRALPSLAPGELRMLRSRVGFVPQDLALVPELRVHQNVTTGRAGRTNLLGALRDLILPSRATIRDVYARLEQVGIADKLYERTSSLSGGERQRVAIARALFQEPDALLADEPIASVDPARARDLIRQLLQLAAEDSRTLFVSLHDERIAREYFPRLIGLREGRVRFDRRSEDLGDQDLQELYDLTPGTPR